MIYDITLTVVDSSTSTTHAGAAVSIEVVQVVGQVNTGGGGAVTSVAGRTGDVTLTKTDVGLANVDNTADAAKPVSTAQATADAAAQAAAEATAANALAAHVSAADPHTGYQKWTEKGQANGYASLDGDGKVPAGQLPTSSGANIQRFTTAGSHTWTNPSPSTPRLVRWYIRGGTGGGGSGRKGAPGTSRCGGGGGAAGGVHEGECWSTDLLATVPVTVGDGGAGGAGVSTDDTNGNAGLAGSASVFGNYRAPSGGGGGGGTTSSGTFGFPTGSGSIIFGNAGFTTPFGGAASTTGGVGGDGPSTSQYVPTGGGAGGGITSGNVASAGGAGGARGNVFFGYAAGVAGGLTLFNPSVNGFNGTAVGSTLVGRDGMGGGGGAGALSGTAGCGGDGSAPGGGGGGGGAVGNGVGNTSGAGGVGARGYVEITTFL